MLQTVQIFNDVRIIAVILFANVCNWPTVNEYK